MAETTYDVVIIGAGPAGIQAAIHAARRKIRVLMLGRIENSALYGAHIENYAFVPGSPAVPNCCKPGWSRPGASGPRSQAKMCSKSFALTTCSNWNSKAAGTLSPAP